MSIRMRFWLKPQAQIACLLCFARPPTAYSTGKGSSADAIRLRDCCGHRTLLVEKRRWPDGRQGG